MITARVAETTPTFQNNDFRGIKYNVIFPEDSSPFLPLPLITEEISSTFFLKAKSQWDPYGNSHRLSTYLKQAGVIYCFSSVTTDHGYNKPPFVACRGAKPVLGRTNTDGKIR